VNENKTYSSKLDPEQKKGESRKLALDFARVSKKNYEELKIISPQKKTRSERRMLETEKQKVER